MQFPYIISQISWRTVLDLAAVTLIFYWFLTVVRGTRAVQLVRGIIILWLASALLSTVFHLATLTWVGATSGQNSSVICPPFSMVTTAVGALPSSQGARLHS